MIAVVVAGLGAGSALASLTRPATPSVVALPAVGQGSSAQGNGGQAGNPSGARQGAAQAAADQAGRAVAGSVASVDSNTLTVRGQQGDVKVNVAGARVVKMADGTAADLKNGERVAVTAQQESDGSYTATNIVLLPADQAAGRTAIAQGSTGAQTGGTGGGQNAGRGQGQAQAQGQGQQSGDSRARPVVGTISTFDGSVLTVTGQQGDTKVKVGSAHIQKTIDGSTKDLQEGQRVLVSGQQGADGSYNPSEIQILASGDTPAGGQGARQQ